LFQLTHLASPSPQKRKRGLQIWNDVLSHHGGYAGPKCIRLASDDGLHSEQNSVDSKFVTRVLFGWGSCRKLNDAVNQLKLVALNGSK
jgi:hypothetical protein